VERQTGTKFLVSNKSGKVSNASYCRPCGNRLVTICRWFMATNRPGLYSEEDSPYAQKHGATSDGGTWLISCNMASFDLFYLIRSNRLPVVLLIARTLRASRNKRGNMVVIDILLEFVHHVSKADDKPTAEPSMDQ